MVSADSPEISRVSGYSGAGSADAKLSLTGLSPAMAGLSSPLQLAWHFVTAARCRRTWSPVPTTPTAQRRQAITRSEFRLVPVRSPLLGESFLLSSLPDTKMFQFSGLPRSGLWIHPAVPGHDSRGVAPFGNVRINVCRRLLAPYRGLPRPSSAAGAKVSTESPL